MKSFQKAAGAARKRVFGRNVKEEASKMDPGVRSALVEDVASPSQALQQELESIEAEMIAARENLSKLEEKEVFLGQRSRKYRKMLDEKARQLKQEQARLNEKRQLQDQEGDYDQEAVEQAELDRKMEKWEQDEDALSSVVATHKQILGHCETMRWKLKELEVKRQSCRKMDAECTDFLDAAKQARSDLDREAQEAAAGSTEMEPLSDPMIQVINDRYDALREAESSTTDNATASERNV